MRILLLTLYYSPDLTSANAVILTELAEKLAEMGHEVTVVTLMPHYAASQIEAAYRGKLFIKESRQRVAVHHAYLYTSADKHNLLARLLNYASFNVTSTLAALFAGSYDVILCPSPPLTIGLTAWVVGILKRIPFIYNVQDIYPDIAVQLGVLKNRRVIRFFQKMEHFIYRQAAAVSVLSRGFEQNLLDKGTPPEKLHVIPNFVDTAFITPGKKENAFARRHGLADKFVLMYAGNVGLSQGLDHMLAAAERLQETAEILLLIVGNGTVKPELEKEAAERQLRNVLFLPFQPRAALPEMYAAADVALVSLRSDIGRESVPSKAYTIMASGRPLLAAVREDAETKWLVDTAACGVWVPPEQPQALADAVLALYRQPEQRRQMGENGRRYVTEHHTVDSVAQQYIDLIEALIQS